MSFLLETRRALDKTLYAKELTYFIRLIKKLAFEELKLNRIFTETFDIRPSHISVLEQNSFVCEGRMRQHVFLGGRYVDSLLHGLLTGDANVI
jgi:RimJ/RimL family protein N-acetyltransferase